MLIQQAALKRYHRQEQAAKMASRGKGKTGNKSRSPKKLEDSLSKFEKMGRVVDG